MKNRIEAYCTTCGNFLGEPQGAPGEVKTVPPYQQPLWSWCYRYTTSTAWASASIQGDHEDCEDVDRPGGITLVVSERA